jgi:hypothetical protein
MNRIHLLILVTLLGSVPSVLAASLGSSLTYQGRLEQAGGLADGRYDFQFNLWDSATNGLLVGTTPLLSSVPVSRGLFTVALDFGPSAFNGDARWLEIAVRAGSNELTVLNPRQAVTAAPYALQAGMAARVPALGLTGTILDTQLSSNVARLNASPTFAGAVTAAAFRGDGAGLTNLDAHHVVGEGGDSMSAPTSGASRFLGHSFARYTEGKPLRLWGIGDSVGYGLAERFVTRWTSNHLGMAGGQGIGHGQFFQVLAGGPTRYAFNYSNCWWGEYELATGGLLTNYSASSNGILANAAQVFYLAGPEQGAFTLSTGAVVWGEFALLATVDARASTVIGVATNFPLPLGAYTLKFESMAGSNTVFGLGLWNTNGRGVRTTCAKVDGSSFGTWAVGQTNIFQPLLREMGADLVFVEVKDGAEVRDTFPWVATNILQVLGGDVVLVGTSPNGGKSTYLRAIYWAARHRWDVLSIAAGFPQ